jgi:hypothetical protein
MNVLWRRSASRRASWRVVPSGSGTFMTFRSSPLYEKVTGSAGYSGEWAAVIWSMLLTE